MIALDHMAHLHAERRRLAIQLKEVEDRLGSIDGQIKEAMGDDVEATIDGVPVYTWKWTESHVLDQTLLKSAHPQVYQECKTTRRSRRFVPVKREQVAPDRVTDSGPDTTTYQLDAEAGF